MSLTPLPNFGVEATWNTPISVLRQALVEHGLILLRDRVLSPPAQVGFSHEFGATLHRCSPRLARLLMTPEVFVFSNQAEFGSLNNGHYWHHDGIYLRHPAAISIHHVPVTPDDSVTSYADCWALYDTFDEFEQAGLRELSTRTQTGIVVPLVIEAPPTRRPGLYVNIERSSEIVGAGARLIPNVAAEIASRLDIIGEPHHWRRGDTIVTNALRVAHRAFPCAPSPLRLLHRTTITGDSVFWTWPANPS